MELCALFMSAHKSVAVDGQICSKDEVPRFDKEKSMFDETFCRTCRTLPRAPTSLGIYRVTKC
jgi:hypothetical protein